MAPVSAGEEDSGRVGGVEEEGAGEREGKESSVIRVEYHMGPYHDIEELPDGLTEDEVQERFETWLSNRSDIGWHLVEGELKQE